MYQGDLVTVDVTSTQQNADWWTGTVRGQTGIFPSTYVERLMHALPPSPPAPAIMKSSRPSSEVSAPTYTPYRSTHNTMNPNDGGPNALGLQPAQTDEQKAGKYNRLKSTVRNEISPSTYYNFLASLFLSTYHPCLWVLLS